MDWNMGECVVDSERLVVFKKVEMQDYWFELDGEMRVDEEQKSVGKLWQVVFALVV